MSGGYENGNLPENSFFRVLGRFPSLAYVIYHPKKENRLERIFGQNNVISAHAVAYLLPYI